MISITKNSFAIKTSNQNVFLEKSAQQAVSNVMYQYYNSGAKRLEANTCLRNLIDLEFSM